MYRSSGDPTADRRYAYAESAARDGDWRAAAEVLAQALERAPQWAPAWLALGEAREKLAETESAVAAYRAALALDPEDPLGAAPRLARLGAFSPTALPQAYVRELFNDYAPRYEKHLTEGLAYRGPTLIVQALDDVAPNHRFARAFDLGCGDGLMGAALRSRVEMLIGVDLSPAMATKARHRGVYDEAGTGEICAFLESRAAASADLIVAADALPYFGDLNRLFLAAARALAQGGFFVFTAEAFEGDGYRLGATLRFAHSRSYLADCCRAAELVPRLLDSRAARREHGDDAPGWLCLFERNV
jgi:predicted TPR repeat methyltransferase